MYKFVSFKKLLLVLTMMMSVVTHAEVITLSSLIDADTEDVTKLYLHTNDLGDLVKMTVISPDQKQVVRIKDLRGSGKTVYSKMGINIIVLKSHNMDKKLGGDVVIDYLVEHNFFSSNKRSKKYLELIRNDNDWVLMYKSKPVKKMIVVPHAKGIKNIKIVTK